MKKLLIILTLMLACVGVAHGAEQPLTPEQQQSLQVDVDILGICVVDALSPYILYGFTTEYAVSQGFESCRNEGQMVMDRLDEFGLTESEKGDVALGLFHSMVVLVDNTRNAEAQKRMEESKKKRKPNAFQIPIEYLQIRLEY